MPPTIRGEPRDGRTSVRGQMCHGEAEADEDISLLGKIPEALWNELNSHSDHARDSGEVGKDINSRTEDIIASDATDRIGLPLPNFEKESPSGIQSTGQLIYNAADLIKPVETAVESQTRFIAASVHGR